MAIRDYYAVLGVANAAGIEDIKRRFRNLAKQAHPDVAGESAERFLALQEAYRVLCDPVARERYDRERERERLLRGYRPAREAQEQHAPARRGREGGIAQFVREFLGDAWSPGDPPSPPSPPSPSSSPSPSQSPPPSPGREPSFEQPVPVVLDLVDAFNGKEVTLDGIRVRIPPGARHDSVMRIPVAADAQASGPYRFIRIAFRPDAQYGVSGDDLHTDVVVDSALAAAGGEVGLSTPGGRLTLSLPPGVADGQLLRLRGRGLPPTAWRRGGDLLVRVVRAG